nr:hypothetical protein B0A51_11511 [Rachicladosporium sp. CCFEE 5018]
MERDDVNSQRRACTKWPRGECMNGEGCNGLHHANVDPAMQPLPEHASLPVDDEWMRMGVICERCLNRGLKCDKKDRPRANDPCSGCRHFLGNATCNVPKSSNRNHGTWSLVMRREPDFTLQEWEHRHKTRAEDKSWDETPVVPKPMPLSNLCDNWQGMTLQEVLDEEDWLPADVRARPRAYLKPPGPTQRENKYNRAVAPTAPGPSQYNVPPQAAGRFPPGPAPRFTPGPASSFLPVPAPSSYGQLPASSFGQAPVSGFAPALGPNASNAPAGSYWPPPPPRFPMAHQPSYTPAPVSSLAPAPALMLRVPPPPPQPAADPYDGEVLQRTNTHASGAKYTYYYQPGGIGQCIGCDAISSTGHRAWVTDFGTSASSAPSGPPSGPRAMMAAPTVTSTQQQQQQQQAQQQQQHQQAPPAKKRGLTARQRATAALGLGNQGEPQADDNEPALKKTRTDTATEDLSRAQQPDGMDVDISDAVAVDNFGKEKAAYDEQSLDYYEEEE